MKHLKKSIILLSIFFLISKIAFSKPLNSDEIKVIHGDDNRVDTTNLVGSRWEEASRAVALRVSTFAIKKYDENFSQLSGLSLERRQNVCYDESFSDQIVAGSCTGFLVGDQYLVTAGHCMKQAYDCKFKSWVFGYAYDSSYDYTIIPKEDIYKCEEVVSMRLTPGGADLKIDYALIKLDRPVTGRTPLKVRKEGTVSTGTKLAIIGHPDGIPMKFADGARVIGNTDNNYFSANLDSFHGNSGSPVFNYETGEVEGILVRGATDYIEDEAAGCYRVNVIQNECADGTCNLEDVTRITIVNKLLEVI